MICSSLNRDFRIRPPPVRGGLYSNLEEFQGRRSDAIEIGAAWTKQARDTGRTYLSVKLDDPCFPAPIFASLHKADGGTFNLVWSG
jgi:uncharacterized protein (DUF736 family)